MARKSDSVPQLFMLPASHHHTGIRLTVHLLRLPSREYRFHTRRLLLRLALLG